MLYNVLLNSTKTTTSASTKIARSLSCSSTNLVKLTRDTGKGKNRRLLNAKKLTKKDNPTKTLSFALTRAPPSGLELFAKSKAFKSTNERAQILYPKEIVSHLNKFVVGQEEAKKCLAVAVYQHYRRVENNLKVSEKWILQEAVSAAKGAKKSKKDDLYDSFLTDYAPRSQRQILQDMEKRDEILLDKSNMLLLGASGTGKTFVTQKLSEILDVPIAICDCTTLTQAGYVGDDVDTVISKLLAEANGDIDRCQKGIVFLDEFDKIYTSSDPLHTAGNRDVSGKGVQQALLKLVEGTIVKVRDPLAPNTKVEVDTTNILFVASGAFSNIEHIVARRMNKRELGFAPNSQLDESKSDNNTVYDSLRDDDESVAAKARDELVRQCDQGDLISFGMIPELVGRFPVIVPFHSLDKEHLMSVLTEPKGCIIAQAKKFFENEKVDLRFSSSAIDQIADLAVKRRTGARALKSIVEKAVMNAKYEIPGSGVKVVEITDENLRDNSFTILDDQKAVGESK